jgi:hypothetical protein
VFKKKVTRMKIRNVAVSTLVAGGLGLAGLMGASPASALGIAGDLNGDGQGFSVGSGASVSQTGNAEGNRSLAISILGPSATSASGNASGNTLVAIDGLSSASGNASGNTVVTAFGVTSASGNAKNNTLVNVGGVTKATGNASGATSLAVCGTSLSGQFDHVTVSPGVCG